MTINKYLIKLIETSKGMDRLDFFMGKSSLSKTEFRLLQEVIIARENGKEIISSELARKLRITRSAVSQMVTKLEKQNVVKRVAAENDRKIAYIRLSDFAEQMFLKQCERANCVMEELTAEFGTDRLDRFFAEYDDLCKAICDIAKRQHFTDNN